MAATLLDAGWEPDAPARWRYAEDDIREISTGGAGASRDAAGAFREDVAAGGGAARPCACAGKGSQSGVGATVQRQAHPRLLRPDQGELVVCLSLAAPLAFWGGESRAAAGYPAARARPRRRSAGQASALHLVWPCHYGERCRRALREPAARTNDAATGHQIAPLSC